MNFIRRTVPAHTSQDVPVDQEFSIDFFKDLNRRNIKDKDILLFNVDREIVEPVTYHYNRRNLTITPSQKMNGNTHYQLHLKGGEDGLKDITGQGMFETYVLEFETGSTKELQAPTIISPTHLSEVSDDIVFKWDAVDDAQYYELQIAEDRNFQVLVWPTEDVIIHDIEVNPKMTDMKVGRYYARIRSSNGHIESEFSDPVQFYVEPESSTSESLVTPVQEDIEELFMVSSITSLEEPSIAPAASEPLKLKGLSPKKNSVNMAVTGLGNIKITFNKAIDETTVTEDTCYLYKEKN